jgi:hypothetical protein
VFFWLWPTITEISIWKFGSIKTNVEQAKTYLNQMKALQNQVRDITEKIAQDAQAASKLQADAAQMRADFDKENTELRAKAANLQSEISPRHLNGPLFLSILGDSPKGEFELVYGAEDQDSLLLSHSLRELLKNAGWQFIDEKAIPLATLLKQATAFPMNVQIEVHVFGKPEEQMPILSPQDRATKLGLPRTLYSVVSGAIMAGLGGVETSVGGTDPSLPDNRVRITVFPRFPNQRAG